MTAVIFQNLRQGSIYLFYIENFILNKLRTHNQCSKTLPMRIRQCPLQNCKGRNLEIDDCCDVSCPKDTIDCKECKIATCAAIQQEDPKCLVHFNTTLKEHLQSDCVHQCSCPIGLYSNGEECVPKDQCYCVLADLTKVEPEKEVEIGCYTCLCTGKVMNVSID